MLNGAPTTVAASADCFRQLTNFSACATARPTISAVVATMNVTRMGKDLVEYSTLARVPAFASLMYLTAVFLTLPQFFVWLYVSHRAKKNPRKYVVSEENGAPPHSTYIPSIWSIVRGNEEKK